MARARKKRANVTRVAGGDVLDGVMLLWLILTIPSVLFVAIDIFVTTPEATVMKWAFIILTVFTGPIGAFFYVLACREPIKGTHEQYVDVRWRQVVGSTMHCAAGDGVGIVFGAAIAAGLGLSFWPDFAMEYLLGFSFGWGYFQSFAMKDMAGGSYTKSLKMTFLPEFLSMNTLMSGMLLVSQFAIPRVDGAASPGNPEFWFVMSMALLVGFIFAYPMNWWMVSNHMKHGMITVLKETREQRELVSSGVPTSAAGSEHSMTGMSGDSMPDMSADDTIADVETEIATMSMPAASRDLKIRMVIVSVSTLAATLIVVVNFA